MQPTNSFTCAPRPFWKQLLRPLWVGLAGAIFVAGFVVFKVYEFGYQTIPDLYTQEWVAGMVITHMQLNEGRWPTRWEDLEEAFEINAGQAGRPWTFDELRSRVDVDFSADPGELAKTVLQEGKATFRVVTLKSGKRHHWAGGEPNLMIWNYLQHAAADDRLAHLVESEKRSRAALIQLAATFESDETGHVKKVQLGSRSSDAAMDYIRAFTELRGLNLGDSGVGDAGMECVRDLPHLEWIYLYRSKVTDAGLVHLEHAEELKMLVLADQKFTDAAFDTIVRLKNLEFLNLNGTRVTDAGIARLHGMQSLKNVQLGGTQVTEEGVQQLRAALPECDVYFPSE